MKNTTQKDTEDLTNRPIYPCEVKRHQDIKGSDKITWVTLELNETDIEDISSGSAKQFDVNNNRFMVVRVK